MGPFCYFILFFESVRILFLLFCIWLDHLSLNLGPAFHSDSWTLLVISYKLLSHWRCFESEVPLQLQSAGGDVSRKRVFWPWNRFDWETVQFEKGTAFFLSFSLFFFISSPKRALSLSGRMADKTSLPSGRSFSRLASESRERLASCSSNSTNYLYRLNACGTHFQPFDKLVWSQSLNPNCAL